MMTMTNVASLDSHRRQRAGLVTTLAICAMTSLPIVATAQTTQEAAENGRLTIDEIFDPAERIRVGALPRIARWLDDDFYLERAARSDGGPLLKVEATTGARAPFIDVTAMKTALENLPSIDEAGATHMVWQAEHLLSPTLDGIAVSHDDDLYYYDFTTQRAARLTNTLEREEEPSFSPDGSRIGFVRNHNLFAVDVDPPQEYALTTDGAPRVRNGQLDWVYQEEIYGRGQFTGYWWSPDSTGIAYLQLDDTDVPDFTIVDTISYHPAVEHWAYPKAGDPNPGVRLGIVRPDGEPTAWVDLDEYAESEPLVVSVEWSPDSRQVVFQVQNREQTWLDLNVATPDGRSTHVLRETTEAWVNVTGTPLWLGDGSFLWLSERTGWQHVYHYEADGSERGAVTSGSWEVRQLHGVDEQNGWVYFSGTERSHIGSDVYRVRLDGSAVTRLTEAEGTHRARFNPGFTRFLDTWSDITTPPRLTLRASDGEELAVLGASDTSALTDHRLSSPEFLEVTNRDGFVMNAMMLKPTGFDPTVRYPVYQHVYGGPHIQRVRNAWGGQTYLFWQLLAQRGVVVWVLDGSTASGKGAVSTWPVYQNFGPLELRDLEDGVSWLAEQPFIDTTRIGLEGWSYGGFMVSYALTHSQSFTMGIAGGSVTDWRDYDTIYTERYMRTPQNNPDGYRRSSPRFAAANLHGDLLLIHGTMDENVHMQNTLQFAYALQRAGKPFDMMVYPKSRHRLEGPELEKHRHQTMLNFAMRHLRPTTPGPNLPSGVQ